MQSQKIESNYKPPFFFIPKKETKKISGIKSDSTLFHLIRKGSFPEPYKLSERLSGFRSDELNEWLLTRKKSDTEVA